MPPNWSPKTFQSTTLQLDHLASPGLTQAPAPEQSLLLMPAPPSPIQQNYGAYPIFGGGDTPGNSKPLVLPSIFPPTNTYANLIAHPDHYQNRPRSARNSQLDGTQNNFGGGISNPPRATDPSIVSGQPVVNYNFNGLYPSRKLSCDDMEPQDHRY